jgi:hypothetical protein
MGLPQPKYRRISVPQIPVLTLIILVLMTLVTILPAQMFATTKQLSCSPTALVYGNVAVGVKETLLASVTNNGPTRITISKVSASSGEFKVSNLKLPRVLAVGARLEVSLTFVPARTGAVSGQLTFFSNASNRTLNLEVSGAGVISEIVTARPRNLWFGELKVGESSTLPVVLTNTRDSDVTLTRLQTVGSVFSVTGAKFPLTLGKGKSVTLRATFKPNAEGVTGGSSFVTGPSLNIPLIGTGTSTSKPKLTLSPASMNFGKVAVGTTATLTVALRASGGKVDVSSLSSSSSQFALQKVELPLTIPDGSEVSIKVKFTPKDEGNSSGALAFASNAADTRVSEALAGTGTAASKPELTISPTTLNFGDVAVGEKVTRAVTLHASGGAVEVSSISSNNSQFAAPKLESPLTVPAGKEVAINVTFSPNKDGGASGALAFASNAADPRASESLAGTGTAATKPELTINPSTLSFGKVAVGGTATLTVGLHATGGSVDVSSISSNSSQFSVQKVEFPITVPVGKEVSLNITFTPKNDGNSSAALSFASNGSDSRVSEPLAGTGTAPFVSLSWEASTSEHITGYNVYRSTSSSAAPTKINSKLDPDTTYADATVASGHTYYYSTTAVNSSGKESAHSERVEVAVP